MHKRGYGGIFWLAGGAVIALAGLEGCGDTINPVTGLTCGTGTMEEEGVCVVATSTETDDHPVLMKTPAKFTSLDIDRSDGSTAYVNNPIHARLGVTAEGEMEGDVQLTLALMEKPAPDATEEDLLALHQCGLAGARLHINKGTVEQFVEFDGVVPPECLEAGVSERTYNFMIVFDLLEEKTGASPETKFIVFNQRESASPIGKICRKKDPVTDAETPGCVFDLVVKPSPGLDIDVTQAEPTSSVIVVYPPGQHPDVRLGMTESVRALLQVNTEVQALGRDDDDADADVLPDPVELSYYLRAEHDDDDVGWQPLAVNQESAPEPITKLGPGQKLRFTANLYPSAEVLPILRPGGAWSNKEDFLVRACATVPFPENGDPLLAGVDGTANNCKEFPLRLIRSGLPPSLANSYSANYDYPTQNWGSSSSVKVSLTAYTHNGADLTGAHADVDTAVTLSSVFGGFTIMHLWGYADATISPAEISWDPGVSIFDVKLYGSTTTVGTYAYDRDIKYTKEKCKSYVFVALVVPIEVEFCVSGEAGVDFTVELNPLLLKPGVRPHASLDASATASLEVIGFRVSIEANVTILGINSHPSDGLQGRLQLTPNLSASPPNVSMTLDLTCNFSISTLDVSLVLIIEQQEPDICHKKVLGVKVPYPCLTWDTILEYTIASFNGWTYTQKLLDRESTQVLQ